MNKENEDRLQEALKDFKNGSIVVLNEDTNVTTLITEGKHDLINVLNGLEDVKNRILVNAIISEGKNSES